MGYMPFIEYFLGVLFLSYREYDRRLMGSSGSLDKSERVREVVLNVNYPVSKRDIMELVPDISAGMVDRVMSSLVRESL